MRKKIVSFILSILLIVTSIIPMLAFSASAKQNNGFMSDYYQIPYTSQNGLFENSVYDITATADGMLWFATGAGLAYYDGFDFGIINKENTSDFDAVTITKLFADSKGRLWVATNDAGLLCKTNDGFKSYDTNMGAPSNSVKDIAERADGTIVVATAQGIYSIDENDNITVFENKTGSSVQSNMLMVDSSNNKILCVTVTGSVLLIEDNTITNKLIYGDITNSDVTCVYYIESGHFRCATDSGEIIDIFGDEVNYTASKIETGIKDISQLYQDKQGNWWVVSEEEAGYIDSNGEFTSVDNLGIDNITSMYVDFQGNYWFSSDNAGLIEMCKGSVQNLNNKYSLERGAVNCAVKVGDILYIGTPKGLTAVNERTSEHISNKLTQFIGNNEVTDFAVDENNNIYVSTKSMGIVVCDSKNKITQMTENDGLQNNKVNEIELVEPAYIAAGTDKGITIVSNRENSIWSFNENTGLMGNVRCVHKITDGEDWIIGTESNGIYRLSGDKISRYSDSVSDIAGSVNCITDLSDNSGMWVGIGARLFYFANDGTTREISKLRLLHSIADIIYSPNGEVWIITSDSIIIADEANLLSTTEPLLAETIDKSEGLFSNVNKNSNNFLSDDGVLYLGCDDGLAAVDTANYVNKLQKPKFTLKRLSSDQGEIDNTKEIRISDSAQKFIIDLSVLSYLPYEKYEIKYKLSKQDQDYSVIPVGSTNEIVYTNLSGGDYTFEALLFNTETGENCGTVTFEVKKEYSYAEQWVFKMSVATLGIIIIAVLAYLAVLFRTRRVKKKQQLYKDITEEAMVSFAKAIDAKDNYTKGHSERVAKYSVEIARRYGISADRLDDIYYTALLHDIGKIGIPDSILKKPDKLTDEEFEIIKTHTTVGAEILSGMTKIKNVQCGARDHHEKYNGTGYPRGLSDNRISFEGRIVGAADAYDAMTTLRGYNETYDKEHTKSEILEQSGQQFDPKIAQILIDMIDDGYFDKNK